MERNVKKIFKFGQVYFKDGGSPSVNELEIPTCPQNCYVTTFYDIIKDFIPKNYEQSCKLEATLELRNGKYIQIM